MNEVNALIESRDLTSSEGQSLLGQAEMILAHIS
jgi:hypothetical protein